MPCHHQHGVIPLHQIIMLSSFSFCVFIFIYHGQANRLVEGSLQWKRCHPTRPYAWFGWRTSLSGIIWKTFTFSDSHPISISGWDSQLALDLLCNFNFKWVLLSMLLLTSLPLFRKLCNVLIFALNSARLKNSRGPTSIPIILSLQKGLVQL